MFTPNYSTTGNQLRLWKSSQGIQETSCEAFRLIWRMFGFLVWCRLKLAIKLCRCRRKQSNNATPFRFHASWWFLPDLAPVCTAHSFSSNTISGNSFIRRFLIVFFWGGGGHITISNKPICSGMPLFDKFTKQVVPLRITLLSARNSSPRYKPFFIT